MFSGHLRSFGLQSNTLKLINLCALPCLGLGLWLTLTVYFDLAYLRLGRGGVKISLSNLFNYFSVSGGSKQKKIPTKKVVLLTTQKYHFFLRRP